MRAVRLTKYGSPLESQEIDRPRGEVVVHIRAAGICHSDAHYRAGRGSTALPLTLGHEVAGVTDDGRRVAVHYLLPNGDMIGKEADGGYAESIAVPAANIVPIPDEVSFEQAAIMMCSTATALHALRLAVLQPRESLAILGFGGLGFSALKLARALGAGDVFVAERVAAKCELAKKHGAVAVDELPPVDVVLEFSGNEALTLAALRALKPGGRLMIVAINLRSLQIDPYRDVLGWERRIIGVSDHTRDELLDLMEMARAGRIDLSDAITRRIPLDAKEIDAVLDDLDAGTAHLRSVIAT